MENFFIAIYRTLSGAITPGPGVIAPDKVLYMGQIELFDYLKCVQTNELCYIELLEIELFDHLIVC